MSASLLKKWHRARNRHPILILQCIPKMDATLSPKLLQPKSSYLHIMTIKILVVDDEPDVALIFRQKFRRRIRSGELAFIFAEKGRQALDLLEADPELSLVFTDIRMPTMDGLSFLKALRKLDRKILVPLVVSAYDDMPNIREAMRLGAWDFVTKPLDLDDLQAVLDDALSEIRQKREALQNKALLLQSEQDRELAAMQEQTQRDFFQNITHELRTPLTLVLAPLESALDLSSEDQVISYLQQAQKSGHLLLDLVNQLLDFAKVDAAMLQPQIALLDAAALSTEMVAAFQPIAQQKQIHLEIDAVGELQIGTDPKMLARILLNLLSNALKFSPIGGKVSVKLATKQAGLELTVSDTGPGISETEAAKLFQRFQQVEGTASGTGLGLALCKSLSELLKGSLSLQSELGKGSAFTLFLPAWDVTSDTELAEAPDFASLLVSQSATSALQLSGEVNELPTLLIAEDHPDMRSFIASQLQAKFNLKLAEDGAKAFAIAREVIPDIIITDWMMPEMDGLELLKNIRLDRDTTHIPVVMLTAKTDLEDRLQGIHTGAEGFLAKPFHPKELVSTIESLLAQRERQRARFREEMLHPEKIETLSMEDQFLADLKKIMEKHLMDEQFGVEPLAAALAMSRRTLMRKLTAISGQSPVKFIRNYRLERALQMLKDQAAPVWEVAVKTGFGSASYFTKCFKEHYGMSPREALQQS